MKKSLIFLLLMLFMSANAFAASSSAGTTAVPFLKYGAGARAAGMGSAFTAVSGAGSDMVYWNPAGLASLTRRDATLMYLSGLEGISYGWASFAEPGIYGVFGAAIQYMSSGDIDGTDINGESTSSFSTYDLALNFSFARYYEFYNIGILDYGINLKYIYSKIDNSASAFAVDAGAIYTLNDNVTSFGAVFQNAGTGMKYNEETETLPFVFKAGAARTFLDDNFLVAFDINFPNDNDVFVSFGAEYTIPIIHVHDTAIALRAGYDGRQKDIDGFSGVNAGFGLKYRDYLFDYAFSPYGNLGNVHRVSLGIQFGSEFDADTAIKKKEIQKQKKPKVQARVQAAPAQQGQSGQLRQEAAAQEEYYYGPGDEGDYSQTQDYGEENESKPVTNENAKDIAVIDFYSRNIPENEIGVYSQMLRKQLFETGVFTYTDVSSIKEVYQGNKLPEKKDLNNILQNTNADKIIICNSLKKDNSLIFHFTVYDNRLNSSEYSLTCTDSFRFVNEAMKKFAEKLAGEVK
jgi:hypothetical protein